MDSNSQTPGIFVPYSSSQFGTFTGVHSPPASLCSEPIFQMPMADSICKNPGVPLKNSKIQLLNKTLGDARKKKNNTPRGQNISSRAELPSMANFLQCRDSMSSLSALSDCDGGVPMSPLFNYNNPPVQFPQAKISSAQYSQTVNSLNFPQPENIFQFPRELIPQNITKPLVKYGSQKQFMHQWPMQDKTLASTPTWEETGNEKEISARQIRKIHRTEGRTISRSKPTRKSKQSERKQGLISTSKDTKIKTRKMQKKKIQQKNKSLHKTELCTNWMLTSTCSFNGKCYFAHGIEELKKRVRVGNFKTQPCVDSPREESKCMFGSRCYYCHPGEAMRRAVGSSYYDADYYNVLRNDFPKNEYPFGIFL